MTALRVTVLLGAISASACNPILVPTPLQLGETAPPLDEGKVSLTAQGGVAGATLNGGGLAAAGRLRVGLGYGQELGVEGLFGYASVDSSDHRLDGQFGGGKVSYKIAPDQHVAFIFGAGFGTSRTGSSLGGDAALVISGARDLRPYFGARVAAGERVTGGSGPATTAFCVPLGLSYGKGETVRGFLEVGAAGVFTGGNKTGPLYASAGVSFTLN